MGSENDEISPLEVVEVTSERNISADISIYTLTPRSGESSKWNWCCFWNRNGFVVLQEEHEALRSEFFYQQKLMAARLEATRRSNERKDKEV